MVLSCPQYIRGHIYYCRCVWKCKPSVKPWAIWLQMSKRPPTHSPQEPNTVFAISLFTSVWPETMNTKHPNSLTSTSTRESQHIPTFNGAVFIMPILFDKHSVNQSWNLWCIVCVLTLLLFVYYCLLLHTYRMDLGRNRTGFWRAFVSPQFWNSHCQQPTVCVWAGCWQCHLKSL